MRVIVIGAGVVGYNTALMLSQERHDVVVVEESPERIDQIRRKLDVMTVMGSGANTSCLDEAGARQADLVIAATSIDEVNMVACFSAKQMGAKRTIARLRKEEYLPKERRGQVGARIGMLGIDHVVTPEVIAAEEITDVLSSGGAIAVEDFGAGRIKMMEYKISRSPISGVPLENVRFPKPCKVVAIVRPEGTVIPNGKDAIRPGDHIYVVTNREHIRELEPVFGIEKAAGAPRNVTLFGCGRIGYRLAKTLRAAGRRCEDLRAEQGPLRAAGRRLRTREGGVRRRAGPRSLQGGGGAGRGCFRRDNCARRAEHTDGAAGQADGRGPGDRRLQRAGVHRPRREVRPGRRYQPPAAERRRDTEVRPERTGALGRPAGAAAGRGDRAAGGPGAQVVGKPLQGINFPKGAIVGAILRGARAMVPDGESEILAGDRVVVVTVPSAIPAVERLFSGG